MTRERIWRIATVFVLMAALLGIALERTMIARHDDWLERSYLNRWAFRDVPTRRGEILDRRGRRLAWDEPGIDLELVYRSFRREHAVGAALHGANLVALARFGDERFTFDDPDRLDAACRLLLALPVSWLVQDGQQWVRNQQVRGYEGQPLRLVRDLRFYIASMVGALGGPTRSEVAKALSRAIGDPRADDVRAALSRELGPEAIDVEARFAERLDELRALDARLATIVAADDADRGFDLFGALEQRRQAWCDWTAAERLSEDEREVVGDPEFWRWLYSRSEQEWGGFDGWRALSGARRATGIREFRAAVAAARGARDLQVSPDQAFDSRQPLFAPIPPGVEPSAPAFHDEARPRLMLWRLPYALAVWLGGLDERHPGFVLRPSVVREHGSLPGRDDFGSFGQLLGFVSNYWATDEERRDARSASREARDVFERVREAGMLALPEPDLPDELRDALQDRAEASLRQHFRVFGRVGRGGVEEACDQELSGTPGLRFVEHSKNAREQRMFDEFDVIAGRDVHLSIDVDVQAVAERVLSREFRGVESALVAMDAQSGEVLAVASRTRRHPRAGEIDDPERSIAALWPSWDGSVGSIVKPFVALEYLEARARNAELKAPVDFAVCEGRFAPYRTCHHHGHASQDVSEAIAMSCNFFFYEVARQVGRPGLWRALARVGWQDPAVPVDGDAHDAELWSYAPEFVRSPWLTELAGVARRMRMAPRWGAKTRYVEHESIGYSVAASAVDVARAYAGLATGYLPDASLVRGGGARVPLGVDSRHLDAIRAGLRGCVEHGTARRVGLAQVFDRYGGVYGKTGTAIIDRRRQADGASQEIDNAWFAGFLGLDDRATLVVVAVVYQAPDQDGGEIAAPLFRDFLTALEQAGLEGYLDGRALREE